MKPKYTLHERIAVRAYYLSQTHPYWNASTHWQLAEKYELFELAGRKESARKGAATKREAYAARDHLRQLMKRKAPWETV